MERIGFKSSPSGFDELLKSSDKQLSPISYQLYDANTSGDFRYLKRELFHVFNIQLPKPDGLSSNSKQLLKPLESLFEKAATLLRQNADLENTKSRAEEEMKKLNAKINEQANDLEALKRELRQCDKKHADEVSKLKAEIKILKNSVAKQEKEFSQKESSMNETLSKALNPHGKAHFLIPEKISALSKQESFSVQEKLRETWQQHTRVYIDINKALFSFVSSLSSKLKTACAVRHKFLKKYYSPKKEKPDLEASVEELFKYAPQFPQTLPTDLDDIKPWLESFSKFLEFMEGFDELISPVYKGFSESSLQRPHGRVALDAIFKTRKITTVREIHDMQNLLEEFASVVEEHKTFVQTSQDFDLLNEGSSFGRPFDYSSSFRMGHEKKVSHSDIANLLGPEYSFDFDKIKLKAKEVDERLNAELNGLTSMASELTKR